MDPVVTSSRKRYGRLRHHKGALSTNSAGATPSCSMFDSQHCSLKGNGAKVIIPQVGSDGELRKHQTTASASSLGTTSNLVVVIPSHIYCSRQLKLFSNKLVLAFEAEQDTRQTLEWLAAFNQESSISLTFNDVLPNSIYVVQFDSSLGDVARQSLIKRSPLAAVDCYASVNEYGPDFDPCLQRDFRHLVIVFIVVGSPQNFEFLILVLAPLAASFIPSWLPKLNPMVFPLLWRLV